MTAPPPVPDPPGIDIQTVPSREGCLTTVSGDVDDTTAPSLGECLLEVIGRPDVAAVDLDLSRVTFLDSAGLRTLVIAHQTAQRTGRALRIRCGTSQAVTRPLQITGLSAVLTIVDA